ncbi:hypothetical protein CBW46_018485 [Paenibacillus xerothermodurans]|uniref:Uncharacterized protein n=2 Tax=Paenibacillus xerothermodurans TaxID=1977292 RepID=A0A2W1N771_PAEXE|nr:hypothetical protein CBW46_018485 [Paenibacillus xerothermodurans]
MRQPEATVDIQTTPARLEIHTQQGHLSIDNTDWRDALGDGPHLEAMHRIYSTCKQIALQAIAKKVEDGNIMAAIHTRRNAIAELAVESTNDVDNFQFMYMGDASYDNIDIRYQPATVHIQVQQGQVDMDVQVNRPEIQYYRGKLDIYLSDYPSVEIIPPQVNLKI